MQNDSEAELRQEIGKRLKKARKAARNGEGYTQAEVGDILGKKGDGTVSAWETGRALPDALTLRWMAQHYGVSVDELLALKEPGEGSQYTLLDQPRAAPPVVSAPLVKTAPRRPDSIDLPLSDLVRVVLHAVTSGLNDEREVRAFLQGVVAGSQVNEGC
jgi:transcriptional regulator with XRE-family HTH domain